MGDNIQNNKKYRNMKKMFAAGGRYATISQRVNDNNIILLICARVAGSALRREEENPFVIHQAGPPRYVILCFFIFGQQQYFLQFKGWKFRCKKQNLH